MNYEKLLEKAKEAYSKCATGAEKRRLEYIFPELAESEDEMIRKEIINYLKCFIPHNEDDLVAKSKLWIAWLEKQGENSKVIFPTFTFDDILAIQCCMQAMSKSEELYKKLQSLHDRLHEVYGLENHGEHKPSWSEEDEKKRTLLINILEVNHHNEYFKVNSENTSNIESICTEELVSWLKSIKCKDTIKCDKTFFENQKNKW